MQDYSRDGLVPSITVHYNGFVLASMQGLSYISFDPNNGPL
jgi:hypothetical protein